jgi:hypothetical protein
LIFFFFGFCLVVVVSFLLQDPQTTEEPAKFLSSFI